MVIFSLASWDTTTETLFHYFTQFGKVTDCNVVMNRKTGIPRGFGFVTFANPGTIKAVLAACPHKLDGRTIDAKASLSGRKAQEEEAKNKEKISQKVT